MSIAQQIDRINNNISSAYDGLESAGAEMPNNRKSANLRNTVDSLPLIGSKMDRMATVSSAEERQLLQSGQLFRQQTEIGITDPSANDGYTLFAKKSDLSVYATKTELAALAQSESPVFVQQVSDCVDTTKLYVLPDGYIYAYGTVSQEVPDYTNLVPTSTTNQGAVYNSTGYKDGAYVSGVSDGTRADHTATGYISYPVPSTGLPPTIYVKGAAWNSSDSYTRLSFFTSAYGFLSSVSISGTSGFGGKFTLDVLGENYFKLTPVASGNTSALYAASNDIGFIRMSFEGSGSGLIIATSPIVNRSETVGAWINTGVSFVQSDNENRIIALENGRTSSDARITAIENTISAAAEPETPSYVAAEARRTSKTVLSHQNADTVTFVAVTDAHYSDNSADIVNAVTHAGQGIREIGKRIHLDFGAVLGDNGWQAQTDSLDDGIDQIMKTNRLLNEGLRDIPNLRVPGNHCSQIGSYYTNHDYHRNSDLYPLYGAYNTGAAFDANNRRRGYCYRDFDDRKLRVICLNTSDLEVQTPDVLENHEISAAQLRWLISALDVSTKTNPTAWQILILGHAPLDWCEKTIPAVVILNAYQTGASGSVTKGGETVTFDFTGSARGSIIAQIHGHTHDYEVAYLHRPSTGDSSVATGIKRIAVPNACFSRNNQYGNGEYSYLDVVFGDSVTYDKTAGTAQDTAFTVVTVDLNAHMIYADRYGAGIDRTISY